MLRIRVVTKLWLSFTLTIVFVIVPLEVALGKLLSDFYGSQVTEPLLYHSEQLARILASDPKAIEVAPLMGQMVGGEVLILDPSGVPIAFPGGSDKVLPDEIVRAVLSGQAVAKQVSLENEGLFIVTAVPISVPGGAVALLAPAEPMQRSLTAARRYLWLAGIVTLLAGTALSFMLARSLIRPVVAIKKATELIAQGDFSARVTVEPTDEIGELAAAVNQMTAQLKSYDHRRREFLANVAHEIRTPLSYIRGYAQALAEGLVTNEEERTLYLQVVHEESVRLGRLVNDLMDLAEMDEGRLSLDLTELDVALPIDQAVSTIRPLAQEREITLKVNIPEKRPLLRADGERIQQVFVNLLDNGLRHTPIGGTITIWVSIEEDTMTCRVTDTGPGIPEEELPMIFERFHKYRSSGRGLGLAIARSIVRAHGGEIGAESEPGKGTTIWVRLPIHRVDNESS